jgi:membrane protein YqaA with SNARE-associated domain
MLLAAAAAAAARHTHQHAHTPVPRWLLHLGLPGLALVSLLDACPIPLPLPGSTDLLLLLLCAQHDAQPVLLAAVAIVSSVVGGYLTWRAGQKGGEKLVELYSKGKAGRRIMRKLQGWVGNHGGATVAVSAIAPPPVPLLPLLLGAGALGVSRRQYLLAFTAARGVRYGLVAWLGATYGRRVLRYWNQYLQSWTKPILWTFFSLLAVAIVFGVWQYRRLNQQLAAGGAERAPRADAQPEPSAS